MSHMARMWEVSQMSHYFPYAHKDHVYGYQCDLCDLCHITSHMAIWMPRIWVSMRLMRLMRPTCDICDLCDLCDPHATYSTYEMSDKRPVWEMACRFTPIPCSAARKSPWPCGDPGRGNGCLRSTRRCRGFQQKRCRNRCV